MNLKNPMVEASAAKTDPVDERNRRRRLIYLGISTSLILLSGTVVYHFTEGWHWLDAFYFSAITLTTVGYGDFSPATDFGKVFTVFYILIGIGLIFAFIDALFVQRTERARKRGEKYIAERAGKKLIRDREET